MNNIKKVIKNNKFTLLELLIVVAILAIISAGIVTAYSRVRVASSRAQAARDISALTQALRLSERSINNELDDLDSLLAVSVDTGNTTGPSVNGTLLNIATALGSTSQVTNALEIPLYIRLGARELSQQQLVNLRATGLTRVRYLDIKGEDEVTDDATENR